MPNWKEVPRCKEDDKEEALMKEEEMKDVIAEIRADRKKHKEELKEKIVQQNPEALFADGLDECLAGYTPDGRAVYHIEEIIGTLMNRDGMSEEEALEFFYFNIECAYVGEFTPLYFWEE
jgi:endo-alpha-1,4-polygalactosaminidase (GH114 family)